MRFKNTLNLLKIPCNKFSYKNKPFIKLGSSSKLLKSLTLASLTTICYNNFS